VSRRVAVGRRLGLAPPPCPGSLDRGPDHRRRGGRIKRGEIALPSPVPTPTAPIGFLPARQTVLACLLPRLGRLGAVVGPREWGLDQLDAIDRTRWEALLAAGALLEQDRVHLPRRAHDRIHRANLETPRAPDAIRFDDAGYVHTTLLYADTARRIVQGLG
jgi:hypothetical protein